MSDKLFQDSPVGQQPTKPAVLQQKFPAKPDKKPEPKKPAEKPKPMQPLQKPKPAPVTKPSSNLNSQSVNSKQLMGLLLVLVGIALIAFAIFTW